MTELNHPGDGDSEIAAPTEDQPHIEGGVRGGEADVLDDGEDDEVVRSENRSRPSNAVLLLGAVLVVVIAQLVMTWLVLGATTQLRDQSTLANGLQKCIIHAQLNENSATDASGAVYKAAVGACVNK